MAHLLETGHIRHGDEDLYIKLELFGSTRPQIDKIHDYRWNLKIKGNKNNQYIKEMNVKFSFEGAKPTALEIREFIPTKTKTELMTVDVNILTTISVHIPITQDKITVDKVDSAIKWNFRDIDLGRSDTFSELFEGVVTAIFSSDSKNEPIKIAMEIQPAFYKKKIPIIGPWNVCVNTPIIKPIDVTNKCKDIIPYDPIEGKPGSTPIIKIYDYLYTDNGILKKGEIRNVSLRAESFSRFFDKLRRSLPENQCSKILKEAGKEIGQNFIGDLKTKILNKSKISVDEWASYDSSAGMGRFEVDKNFKIVTVKNSFNAFNTHSDKPVCHFLEGYFEGILSILLEKEVSINEIYCIAKGDEVCRFEINEKEILQNSK